MCYYVYLLIDPTTSQPFYVGKGKGRRMYDHFRLRNRLSNMLLRNKILKIERSGENIIYEKYIEDVDEPTAFDNEVTLIQKWGRKVDGSGILCNVSSGGEGNSSSWTEERKRNVSKRMKGHRGNLPIISKPVTQYDLDGNFIAHFESAKHAGEQTAANRSYITAVCRKVRKSSGGFLWTYNGDPKPTFAKTYYSAVSQYNKDGSFIAEYRSITEAVAQTGIGLHAISSCCRGLSKTSGGFVWKYSPS